MTNSQYWDIIFYYDIHCKRQQANWLNPVTYWIFCRRLKKMNLHDAIYTPRAEQQVKRKKQPPTEQDFNRRIQELKEENVNIVTFEHMEKVEQNSQLEPKPKQNWWNRFISLFR